MTTKPMARMYRASPQEYFGALQPPPPKTSLFLSKEASRTLYSFGLPGDDTITRMGKGDE